MKIYEDEVVVVIKKNDVVWPYTIFCKLDDSLSDKQITEWVEYVDPNEISRIWKSKYALKNMKVDMERPDWWESEYW